VKSGARMGPLLETLCLTTAPRSRNQPKTAMALRKLSTHAYKEQALDVYNPEGTASRVPLKGDEEVAFP
jgi:hypothetical protein